MLRNFDLSALDHFNFGVIEDKTRSKRAGTEAGTQSGTPRGTVGVLAPNPTEQAAFGISRLDDVVSEAQGEIFPPKLHLAIDSRLADALSATWVQLGVRLPFPDASLAPNKKNGRHWTGSQTAKVNARAIGQDAGRALALHGDALDAQSYLPLELIFCAPDARRRDLDNLHASMKPYLDGLAQELEIDDSIFFPVKLDFGPVDKSKNGYVELRISVKLVT